MVQHGLQVVKLKPWYAQLLLGFMVMYLSWLKPCQFGRSSYFTSTYRVRLEVRNESTIFCLIRLVWLSTFCERLYFQAS